MGSFASFMAMNMQMLTRGWLVLRLADDSPLSLSLVMVSFAAPMTLVSLVGGVLADRIPRKRMVIISQGGNAVLTLLVATLDFTGLVQFWHLIVLGVLNGSLMAFNMPSRQAMLSDIVPEERLMNAISLNNSAMNLTRVVGPALAGVLIVFVDTAGVFYLVCGIYVFSTLSMLPIKAGSTAASASRKGMVGDLGEGFAYVFRDSRLRGLMLILFVGSLFGFSYYSLLPAWAREALDVRSDDLGVLRTLMGVGALVATLILAAMTDFRRRGVLLLSACLAWGVCLAFFSQTTSFLAAVPFLLGVGMVSSVFISLSMTLFQVYAAREMRGRVMCLGMMTFGLMPLSALPFGALAERTGTPDALLVSALMLVAGTLIMIVAVPSLRRIE